MRTYLEEEDINIQLVEPHNHRVNAAERAVQTFKNLFISGLATCDENFPTILWSKLIAQCQDTCNILRTSRVHPKVSAYHCLEGPHDFNRVPWAPPRTRATIFNPPKVRASWGPCALDAWYIGPAPLHYRNWTFFLPSTGGTRVSGQANFYPQHVDLPRENPADEARRLAHKLTQALLRLSGNGEGRSEEHIAALKRLSNIFTQRMDFDPMDHLPRQSSATPTAPAALCTMPRVHLRTTRANTPGILPTAGVTKAT